MGVKDILIVEDDRSIERILELELKHENYSFDSAFDGVEALDLFEVNTYRLVLLDIMLPKMSGTEVCRRIRRHSDVPVIMLTAKHDLSDKVGGLDLGADDYITKPFEMEELLARIRASMRKGHIRSGETETLVMGDLSLNPQAHEVLKRGSPIELTKTEFELLKCLIVNKGLVLTREQILNQVWGYDYYGSTNVLDVYVRYLRNKIDIPYGTETIHTVRGVGYTMKEQP